jgi:hypothetical protein
VIVAPQGQPLPLLQHHIHLMPPCTTVCPSLQRPTPGPPRPLPTRTMRRQQVTMWTLPACCATRLFSRLVLQHLEAEVTWLHLC